MGTAPPILVLVQDLFFRAKIEATARAGGVSVRCVHDVSQLPQPIECVGCLVDLDSAGPAALAQLSEIAGRVPTVAFAAHGQMAALAAARTAGCREVIARSQLAAELPQILARLAAGSPR